MSVDIAELKKMACEQLCNHLAQVHGIAASITTMMRQGPYNGHDFAHPSFMNEFDDEGVCKKFGILGPHLLKLINVRASLFLDATSSSTSAPGISV